MSCNSQDASARCHHVMSLKKIAVQAVATYLVQQRWYDCLEGFKEAAAHLPWELREDVITVLRAWGIMDTQALQLLLANCPRLPQLHFPSCPLLDGSRVAALASPASTFLTGINFRGLLQLTDADVITVVSASPALQQVNLSNCLGLTDAAVEAIGKLQCLANLNLSGCQQVAVLTPLSGCSQLTHVNISYCWQITDEQLASVWTASQRLCSLVAGNCSRLTDGCLEQLVQGLPFHGLHLRVLDLRHSRLSDKGMCILAANCPALEDVRVSGCSTVTGFGVHVLLTIKSWFTEDYRNWKQQQKTEQTSCDSSPAICPVIGCGTDIVAAPLRAMFLANITWNAQESQLKGLSTCLSTLYGCQHTQLDPLAPSQFAGGLTASPQAAAAVGPTSVLHHLLRRCPGLSPPALQQPDALWLQPNLQESVLAAAQTALGEVTTLDLSGSRCAVNDQVLMELPMACPRLESLMVGGCRKVTDKGVAALGECVELTQLDVSCQGLRCCGNQGLAVLLQAGQRSSKKDDSGEASGSPGLQQLSVAGLQISDAILTQQYLGGYSQLQSLDVSGCREVHDLGMLQVLMCCPRLTRLRLGGNPCVTDAFLGCYIPAPRPPSAHDTHVSSKARSHDTGRSTQVVHTSSTGSSRPTGDVIFSGDVIFPPAAPPPVLVSSYSHVMLEDVALPKSAATSTALRFLGRCTMPTGGPGSQRGVHLATPPGCLVGMSPLRKLEVASAAQLCDDDIILLAQRCPQLQKLCLFSGNKLTDASLEAIAQRCTLLKKVALTNSRGVTDSGVQALLASSVALQHLDVSACVNLTDNAITCPRTATGCSATEPRHLPGRFLRSLKIDKCSRIGDGAILHLAARWQHLETLSFRDTAVSDTPLPTLLHSLRHLRTLCAATRRVSGSFASSLDLRCTADYHVRHMGHMGHMHHMGGDQNGQDGYQPPRVDRVDSHMGHMHRQAVEHDEDDTGEILWGAFEYHVVEGRVDREIIEGDGMVKGGCEDSSAERVAGEWDNGGCRRLEKLELLHQKQGCDEVTRIDRQMKRRFPLVVVTYV